MYQNLSREFIKILSEKNECFLKRKIPHNPGNLHPILEARYLIIKYEEWAAKKLDRILPKIHITNSVSSSKPTTNPLEGSEKEVGSLVSVKPPYQNKYI